MVGSNRTIIEHLETRGPRALKITQVAEILGVNPVTVWRLAKANALPSFRVGYSIRFDPQAVAAYLKGSTSCR